MKLQKHTEQFDDAQAAKSLLAHSKHFEQQQILIGLHCHWIKSQIHHGEFGPWLQKHAPELCRLKDGKIPQPKMALAEAMKFCTDSAEQAGLTLSQLLEQVGQVQIPANAGISSPVEYFLLEDSKIPAEARALKEKLHKGIQLQLDFENGLKKEKSAESGPRKKLTPTEQHEERVKNIEAHFEAMIAATMLLIQMKDTDFVLPKIAVQRADAIALRFREKVKSLQKQKARV